MSCHGDGPSASPPKNRLSLEAAEQESVEEESEGPRASLPTDNHTGPSPSSLDQHASTAMDATAGEYTAGKSKSSSSSSSGGEAGQHQSSGSDAYAPQLFRKRHRQYSSQMYDYSSSPKARGLNARAGGMRAHDSPPPTWRKVLYEHQPFEDNYVDPLHFLQDLRQNENVKNYRYRDVVMGTFAIMQQISVVVLFVFVFGMVFTGRMSHYSLLNIDVVLLLAALAMYVQFQKHSAVEDAAAAAAQRTEERRGSTTLEMSGTWWYTWDFLRQVLGLGMILVLLSPILCTLTVTYSDDTIVALSIFSMSLHVITADYSYLNAYTTRYQPNLSLNAATTGVILMASRIPNPLESGSLIAFGAMCFSLSPIARHLLKRHSVTAHVAMTFVLFGLSACCLLHIPILAFMYVTIIALIGFVIPECFVVLHGSVKYQINGPWDEAKPTNSAAAAEWANAGLLK